MLRLTLALIALLALAACGDDDGDEPNADGDSSPTRSTSGRRLDGIHMCRSTMA